MKLQETADKCKCGGGGSGGGGREEAERKWSWSTLCCSWSTAQLSI